MKTYDYENHHTCELLGRSFSFPEWSDYCKANRYENPPVYSENGFDWNIYDVCVNPNHFDINLGDREYITIETAQVRNGWYYGYVWNVFSRSMSGLVLSASPCSYKPDIPCYCSESSAIRAALLAVKKHCEPTGSVLAAINAEIFNHSQLTLF